MPNRNEPVLDSISHLSVTRGSDIIDDDDGDGHKFLKRMNHYDNVETLDITKTWIGTGRLGEEEEEESIEDFAESEANDCKEECDRIGSVQNDQTLQSLGDVEEGRVEKAEKATCPLCQKVAPQSPSPSQSQELRKGLKFEDLEAFFFNKGMGIAIGALFCAMNTVVGAHAAYQFTERGGFTTDSDILRITLPIARVGGRLVTFNCAWLLITACKYTWTMIRSHVVPVIPVGFPIDDIMPKYHRYIALWIIFCGCILHALPQILNYAMGAIAIDDGSKVWTFGDGMATRQLLITGALLTLVFATFFLTTFKAFRKSTSGFRWFWMFHMGGIALSYPLLIVHGTFRGQPIFLICALAPLLLYAFDLIKRNTKTRTTKILEWKTHKNNGKDIVELVVECPSNFVYTPGQYVEINYKPISTEEWHPFTIASAPNNDIRVYNGERVRTLVFFIQAVGRWTGSLYHSASHFDLLKARRREISIRGPHGSPASNFFEYKHIIVIGAGVGVTPLLSVWQYMIARAQLSDECDSLLRGSLSKSFSKRFFGMSSRKMNAFNSSSLTAETVLVQDEETSNFRFACSRARDMLESLTVSIFLFCLFLAVETIIWITVIFGSYWTAALFQSVIAAASLIIHVGTIIASVCADEDYRSFKCLVEVAIALADASNWWLSIAFLKEESEDGTQLWTRFILSLGATSVLLHAIRIFHIFYTTLKPQQKTLELTQESAKSKVSSIKGIFINPKYTGMKFCFENLLHPIDDTLSNAFKLQFFGTREATNKVPSSMLSSEVSRTLSSSGSQCYSFHNGRPDFESVLQKEMENVKRSNPTSDEISIGVFFSGSPAVAKSLRSAADKVNAYQQRLASRASVLEHSCNCKVVVHVENF